MAKVKFGVSLHRYWDYGFIRKVALYAEEHDFDHAWLADHLLPPSFLPQDTPSLEVWMLKAALAADTKKIRLGDTVTCNTFRYPSLLAKMGATLDVISGGRLELGIGAGANEIEHEAYGIPFPKHSTRIGMLRESVQIIRGLWTEKKFTFEGEFYKIKDAYCEPKPLQKPNPTIWIGGKSNRILRVVAEHGDGCNFIWMTPEECKERIVVMEHYCEEIGRQPGSIKRSYCADVLLVADKASLENRFLELKNKNVRGMSAGFKAQGTALQDYSKGRFVGTPQDCIDQIGKYTELGFSDFILIFPELDAFDMTGLQFFAEHVLPSFR